MGPGLALLSVRVLSLFFSLPPPLLAVATSSLVAFAVLTVTASASLWEARSWS